MLEPEVIERIRTIFLHRRSRVTLARARALLGWSAREMSEAIRTGEIEVVKTPAGKRIPREELWAKALELWALDAIEEALGPDADRVMPPSLRLADLHLRLPRYQIAMLKHMAERERTSVTDIVTRELENTANTNAEELSCSVTGFAVAIRWPNIADAQPPWS
ncbi:MAG TPA: hypothetical protein VGJ81_14740 [Thermoanaerobaculia bacterium]|jgi:hypothetical protein